MVFKDQCKLPARSPGSSRQAPLREDTVSELGGYLLLSNGFFAAIQDVVWGN